MELTPHKKALLQVMDGHWEVLEYEYLFAYKSDFVWQSYYGKSIYGYLWNRGITVAILAPGGEETGLRRVTAVPPGEERRTSKVCVYRN